MLQFSRFRYLRFPRFIAWSSLYRCLSCLYTKLKQCSIAPVIRLIVTRVLRQIYYVQ